MHEKLRLVKLVLYIKIMLSSQDANSVQLLLKKIIKLNIRL